MHYGVVADIDLNAIAANYMLLRRHAGRADVTGVVKANGYGLGAEKIVETLLACGCTKFYVAHYSEALALRPAFKDVSLAVLNGIPPGAEDEAAELGIIGVINEPGALERQRHAAARRGQPAQVILHVDTGMNRLGFERDDFEQIAGDTSLLAGLNVTHIMSHLASSEEPHNPENAQQLERFKKAASRFPHANKSFANSCGIFLGPNYHFDEVRPGRALSGTNLDPAFDTTLKMAVKLSAPILQIRTTKEGRAVGYNATQHVKAGTRLATLAAGYADGLLRALSNTDRNQQHRFSLENIPVPLVGRVSMDLIVVDVSEVPPALARPGAMVDIAGPMQNMDDLAASAGTSGYEFLTLISPRVQRRYIPYRSGHA